MADILLSGASQGLIWAVLAFGVYISYRLLDIADLSCEGTITLGASAAALLIWRGAHPALALLAAFAAGLAAGCITGLLHTLLRIPAILAGILTMISCYSVNIHIMSAATGTAGTANLSLINYQSGTLFTQLKQLLGLGKQDAALVFGAVFTGLLIAAIYWFFGTEAGCAIRATGDNEKMCRAAGINGLILPDVPYEEKEEFLPACRKYGVDFVSLIAPTSENRIAMIAREAEGFLYIVSSLGVTGERSEIKTDLASIVSLVRENTDIPCAIGFGFSSPEQA